MARINQGYYKKIKKRFKDLESKSEDLESNYDMDSISDREVLWWCLEKCNDLYNECISLIQEITIIINSQKFEQDKTELEYKDMISSLTYIKLDTISRYNTYKSAFGFQFSDAEIRSISEFPIDRE